MWNVIMKEKTKSRPFVVFFVVVIIIISIVLNRFQYKQVLDWTERVLRNHYQCLDCCNGGLCVYARNESLFKNNRCSSLPLKK